ncbi:unnamed protein product, partial [Rotaria sp. Silwood2]
MSFFHYLLLFGNIFLICISLTKAVPLGGVCTIASECDGANATICRDGKCQCDTPWYRPCDTGCVIKRNFVYEGQECRIKDNCINNSLCNSARRCQCEQNYTAINGLCYKNLNVRCTFPNECWSKDCRDGVCKCRLGFIPREDNSRCQRKLARIYRNWIEANTSNDFCYESLATVCLAINAVCQNDSQHTEKFCQCLPTYTANYETQECQSIQYTGSLSPSITPLPNDTCGTCKDENALCVNVHNQRTCWCQAGFTNTNNQCEKFHLDFTFPNQYDISQREYTLLNCSANGTDDTITTYNGLCVCKRGYEFVNTRSACQRIIPKWQNDVFEYGVCTHINSTRLPIQGNDFCPLLLNCEERQDKYVCSCGRNKYLDESNGRCYYFLERDLASPIGGDCPWGSSLNGTQCQCSPGAQYTVSSDKRRCELNLAARDADVGCTNNTTFDTTCQTLYGTNTKFCKAGECQCIPDRSFYSNGTCVTYLYVDPGTNGLCPTNARKNVSSQCRCDAGYRANVGNRTCRRVSSQLYESTDNPPQGDYSDVTREDCKALYHNAYVKVHNNQCLCETGTFSNTTTCLFFLSFAFTISTSDVTCPMFADLISGPACTCSSGYKNNGDNRTCIPITDRVYEHNVTTGVNVTGVNASACRELFGNAAEATQNDGYCRCSNSTVAFLQSNRCLRKPIYSSSLQSIDPRIFPQCNPPYTEGDCVALHGTGAICRNSSCYCDRSKSFVSDNRCVLFSQLVFPGQHERYSRTCITQDDCGSNADQNGIECDFINNNTTDNYKVCKCKPEYFFNPINSIC